MGQCKKAGEEGGRAEKGRREKREESRTRPTKGGVRGRAAHRQTSARERGGGTKARTPTARTRRRNGYVYHHDGTAPCPHSTKQHRRSAGAHPVGLYVYTTEREPRTGRPADAAAAFGDGSDRPRADTDALAAAPRQTTTMPTRRRPPVSASGRQRPKRATSEGVNAANTTTSRTRYLAPHSPSLTTSLSCLEPTVR